MKVGYQILADLQQQQAFKQWGENVGGGGQTVSLPISFEVAFTAVVSADSSWCNASCHITTTTITTMNYQSNKPDIAQLGPVQWLAIGIQPQWGTNTIGSRTTRTEAYPLPYSEFCLPIVSGKGYVGGLNYGFGVGVTNFGLTSVTIANNSEDSSYRWTGYTYIVVGAQPQWGNSASLSGYVAVCIFPISFTTTDYTAVATGVMSAADATFGKENYVNNILWDFTSESQVAFRLSHLDRPTLRYIAIGF